MASNQIVSATSDDNRQSESSETHKKPELSEEKKAEIKAKRAFELLGKYSHT